jgi:hypothetical protein
MTRTTGARGASVSPCRGWRAAVGLAVALTFGAEFSNASAQELADFDYVNLAFRGLGLEAGLIFPTRVEPTYSLGMRMDLGYLGPGLRVVPSISYWSSSMKRAEVAELEERVEELVDREAPPGAPPASVNLGTIDWSDLVLSADAHVVWSIPFDLLSYVGLGASAHILNGGGEAIADTFIEDLLDTVTAGANIHAGLERLVSDHFRLYGTGRFEVLENFQYFALRVGAQFMIGGPAAGETRP